VSSPHFGPFDLRAQEQVASVLRSDTPVQARKRAVKRENSISRRWDAFREIKLIPVAFAWPRGCL
jgi:hypothetical protein